MLPQVPYDGDESNATATGKFKRRRLKMSRHPSAEMIFLKVKDVSPKKSLDITNSILLILSKRILCLLLRIQVMPNVSLEGDQHLSF
ncbi:MAG: hypothetical protein AMJ43_08960 [Coxiella sp. DG_40]|nr:MAG: hypothetical protein AMJ43_08960 [Coxiella sp. DG_40]